MTDVSEAGGHEAVRDENGDQVESRQVSGAATGPQTAVGPGSTGEAAQAAGEASQAAGEAPQAPPAAGGAPPASGAPTRAGGMRWGLILAGVAVAIGVLAGVAALLNLPQRDQALAYVPSGSLYVMELRPDLPDVQRTALGGLVGRFPVASEIAGASDPVEALLDRVIGEASDGSRTYTSDVAAYAAGPMIVAAMPGTAPDGDPSLDGVPAEPDVLVILTTDGSVGCEDLQPDEPSRTEEHAGAEMRIFEPAAEGSDGSRAVACARKDRNILAGSPAAVRAALDAEAGQSGIAGSPEFAAARAELDAEPAAWFFLDGGAVAEMASAAPWPSELPEELRGLAAAGMTEWVAGQVRIETDGIVIETVQPDPGPSEVKSLADRLPSSAVLMIDLSAGDMLPGPGGTPAPGATIPPVPGFPGGSGGDVLPPFLTDGGGLLGATGRAALVVTAAPERSGPALVAELSSPSDAAGLGQLLALLAFSGGSQETYQGTSIFTIPVSSLADASGSQDLEAPPFPFDGEPELAVAIHGDLLVVGLGDAVVKAIIDTSTGATLADQSAYRSAMEPAGPAGLPEMYVDVRGLAPLLEGLPTPGDEMPAHEEMMAWLNPVSTIASRQTRLDGHLWSRTIITIP